MRFTGDDIAVDLPTGWEGRIRGDLAVQGGSTRRTVAQFGNFPLPPSGDDFGADVATQMMPGDVFVVLFEYEPESAGQPLFAAEGPPSIAAADFDRSALQHGNPGQSAVQRFFRSNGRAFCVYAVVGSHLDRADAIAPLNSLLSSLATS